MATTKKEERAEQLYDYAVAHPQGFTYLDVELDLGWQRSPFFDVVRVVRRIFADDEINLICDPQGAGEPWLYRLVGNLDEARGWATNRIGDAEVRLETIHGVVHSCMNATDGRSVEHRKAKIIHTHIGRAIEDLAMLNSTGGKD